MAVPPTGQVGKMMPTLPVITGTIERRILLNYRIDPACAKQILPAPFRPRLHNGHAIGGVCLIRFRQLRPRYVPSALGFTSENAAYRIAVEWDEAGATRAGVYIPRRDTASPFNAWSAGRLFPGAMQRAQFHVEEGHGKYHIEINQPGAPPHVVFHGEDCDDYPATSIFSSLKEASTYVRDGALGYSPHRTGPHHEGMELRLLQWHMSPLHIHKAHIGLFEDTAVFPPGTTQLDSATVMKHLSHEWHGRAPLPCC
jgi:hypothetical protein